MTQSRNDQMAHSPNGSIFLLPRYNHLMQMLELEVQSLKKVDVIKLKGRIDSANVGEFENALTALQQQGRHCLVLDMEKLTYMSSAGLRVMVSALKTAKNKGGNVAVAAPTQNMVDTLTLVGFYTLFPHYDDVLKAVDSF
jgi:anti-sigma B factor antagonist